MIYPLIYLSISLVSVLTDRNRNNLIALSFCVFLFVFIGFRFETGCDFYAYYHRFEHYQNSLVSTEAIFPEVGFYYLNKLVIDAGLDFMWINVFCAAIYVYALYKFSARREYALRYIAIFVPILVIQLGMSGIRQATAVAFLMLAFNAFVDRSRIRFIVCVLLAISFHGSAVIFLPLAFVMKKRPTFRRLIVGICLALPLALFFTADRLDTYQTRYGSGDVTSSGAVFRTGLLVLSALAFEYYRDRYERYFPTDFYLMRIFSLASLGTGVILLVSTIAAHRIGYYIMPVHLLILARLPAVMNHGRPDPTLLTIPFAVYGAYILVWFSLSRHARLCYLPYDSYLF